MTAAFDLNPQWGPHTQAQVYALGGRYRFSPTLTDVEVEIVNDETLWRSVVYLGKQTDTYVFVPVGNYRFYARPVFEDPTGQASSQEESLRVQRLSRIDSLKLYAKKAWALLRYRPQAIVAAGMAFARYCITPATKRVIMAAQVNPGEGGPLLSALEYDVRSMLTAAVAPERTAVSIIIPTKIHFHLLKACIDSLAMIADVIYEIIIVDNGATLPEMCDYLEELNMRPDVRVLRCPGPFNFSRLCNMGARAAQHPSLLFLNDDIEALDGTWLGHMCAFAARPDAGVVGARLLYESRDLQHGGIASNLVPGPGHPWRGAPPNIWQSHPLLATAGEVDAVTAACLMIRRDLFATLGGFNEDDFKITLNDVDLCLRVRETGLKVIYAPQATLLHKEGQSRAADDRPEERARRLSELQAYMRRHPNAARLSCFYPSCLRRDTDAGIGLSRR